MPLAAAHAAASDKRGQGAGVRRVQGGPSRTTDPVTLPAPRLCGAQETEGGKVFLSHPGEVPMGAENAPAPEGFLWPAGLVAAALVQPEAF
jgi:hypothetical protein